jgi:hypothetical protein
MPSSRIIGVIEFRKIVGRGLHTCTLKVFWIVSRIFSCKGLYDLDNDRRMCLTDESQYLMNQSADTYALFQESGISNASADRSGSSARRAAIKA